MKKTMKKVMALLLSFVMFFGCIPTTSNAVTVKGLDNFAKVQDYQEGMFNDVKPGDWYHENVSSVYEINLMIGRENDMFDAEENMTVAEAFTIAARLNSIYYTGKADFIQGELWYEVYTDYCKDNNIADPSKYNLDKAVTRGEFAEIFSKALPEEVLEEINKIKDGAIPDVKMNDAFSAAIYMLYRVGILTGIDEYGTFGSENNIKRMEVAAITTRMAKPSLRKTVELKEKEEEPKQPEEQKQEETKKKKKKSSGPSEQLIPNGTLDAGDGFTFSQSSNQLTGSYNGPTTEYQVELVDDFKLVYTAQPGYYFEGDYTGEDFSPVEIIDVTVERKKVTITYAAVQLVPDDYLDLGTITPQTTETYLNENKPEHTTIESITPKEEGTEGNLDPGDQLVIVYKADPGYIFDNTDYAYIGTFDNSGGLRIESAVTDSTQKYLTVTYEEPDTRILVDKIPVPTFTPNGYHVIVTPNITTGIKASPSVRTPEDNPFKPDIRYGDFIFVTYEVDDGYRFNIGDVPGTNTIVESMLPENAIVSQAASGTYAGKKYIWKYDSYSSRNTISSSTVVTICFAPEAVYEVDNTAVSSLQVLFETTSQDFDGHKPDHVTVESVTPTDGGATGTYDTGDKVVVKFKADDYYIFNKTANHYKETFTSTSDLTVKEAVVDETQKYLTVTFEKKDSRIFVEKIPAPTVTAKDDDGDGYFELDFGTITGISSYFVPGSGSPENEPQEIWESSSRRNLAFEADTGYYINEETIVEEVTIPFNNYNSSTNYTLICVSKSEDDNKLFVTYMLDPTSGYVPRGYLPLVEWYIDSNQEDFIIPRHTTLESYHADTTDNIITVIIKADDGYEFNTDEGYYDSLYDVETGVNFMIREYQLGVNNKTMTFVLSEYGD